MTPDAPKHKLRCSKTKCPPKWAKFRAARLEGATEFMDELYAILIKICGASTVRQSEPRKRSNADPFALCGVLAKESLG
jgi:hypothetical protein